MSYRVYFGRLPDTLLQDDFEKLLEKYGKAKNIEWKSGYAYVDYKHGSDASKTVENLNGKEIGGNNILVELAQIGAGGYSVAGGFSARLNKPLPRPVRTPHRVRIENLSTRAKWMELKELLSLAGEVTFADTHKRKQGEGIVEFANKCDLEEAIKMFDKTLFFGKTIRLYNESPRSRSDRSDSYTRRDSRSPSRRRSSPSSKDRKRRSRSRSKSPDRKVSHSQRRSESTKKPHSKSASPHRKSQKHKYSKSPSSSPTRHTSSKRREHSKSPTKLSRYSHRKSKKSRKDVSRSRSRSPSRKEKRREKDGVRRKHRKSYSSSNSDNENDLKKRKTKNANKKQSSSSGSNSDSASSSNEDSVDGRK